jgi:hypothetical protein
MYYSCFIHRRLRILALLDFILSRSNDQQLLIESSRDTAQSEGFFAAGLDLNVSFAPGMTYLLEYTGQIPNRAQK